LLRCARRCENPLGFVWVTTRFHRLHAARQIECSNISADIRTGTRRDAILYSVSANATHGTRRTNEDKRRAVQILLNDPEWSQWADREIARRCGAEHPMVGRLRPARSLEQSTSEKTDTTKHGTVATMKTDNIGKRDSIDRLYTNRVPAEERIAQIRELGAQGNRVDQID